MKNNLLVLVFTFLSIQNSYSCKCIGSGGMNFYDYHSYDKIFIGKSISIKKLDDLYYIVTFNVLKTYGSNHTSSSIMLKLISDSGACGFEIKKNDVWLITLKTENGVLTTNRCLKNSKSGTVEFKQDSTQLEKIHSFKDGTARLFDLYTEKILLAEGKVEKGLPVGEWRYNYNDGSIKIKGTYLKGKRDGVWIQYDLEDKSMATIRSTQQYIYDKGILKKETTYFNNVKSRETIYYRDDGIEYLEQIFEDEHLDRSFEYRKDETINFKKYNKQGNIIEKDVFKQSD